MTNKVTSINDDVANQKALIEDFRSAAKALSKIDVDTLMHPEEQIRYQYIDSIAEGTAHHMPYTEEEREAFRGGLCSAMFNMISALENVNLQDDAAVKSVLESLETGTIRELVKTGVTMKMLSNQYLDPAYQF